MYVKILILFLSIISTNGTRYKDKFKIIATTTRPTTTTPSTITGFPTSPIPQTSTFATSPLPQTSTLFPPTNGPVTPTTQPIIQKGVGCGFRRIKSGEILQISSMNFNVSDYFNKEECVWRFFGHHCILGVRCPCFDLPPTIKCFGDFLKLNDYFFYDQKFCGDVRPDGAYYSSTNNFKIKFKTDFSETAKGFMCYVYCTAVGKAEPVLPVSGPVNGPLCPQGLYSH